MRSFNPNCTLPHDIKYFVSGPNARGTLDIVWSCISILILCTWTIQHLNIPVQSTAVSKREKFFRTLYLGLRKAKMMALTLLAPEIVLGKAFADFVSASRITKEMQTFPESKTMPWTLTHSFFADMGGFSIEFSELAERPATLVEIRVDGERDVWIRSLVRSLAHQSQKWRLDELSTRTTRSPMGPVQWQMDAVNRNSVEKAIELVQFSDLRYKGALEWYDNLASLQGNIWVLDGPQLHLARELGIISTFPGCSDDDISDRSKSDILVKLISLFQTVWLIVELAARQQRKLPCAQLEIVALAFAACTFFTFLLLLNKPRDVTVPVMLKAARYPTASELVRLSSEGPFSYGRGRGVWLPHNALHFQGERWVYFRTFLIGSIFGSTLFGSFHFIAWSFTFPTRVEQQLWQIAAIITTTAPLISAVGNFFSDFFRTRYWWIFLSSFGFLYVIARLFVLVEMFRSLYFLPPQAFVATWAASIPHAG